MARTTSTSHDASFFNVAQGKWVVGVLSMMIAVVGRESLLGLILRQTRSEINSIVADEDNGNDLIAAEAACYKNN